MAVSGPAAKARTTLEKLTLQVGCSKSRKISAHFFAKQQVAKHAHMINEQSAKRSALKGQPVHSPGQRPGYQCKNAYAL